MEVTPQDLIDLLPIVSDQQWEFREIFHGRSQIRNANNYCPLCALALEIDPSLDPGNRANAWVAMGDIGVDTDRSDAVCRIVAAADGTGYLSLRDAMESVLKPVRRN
jgi:hypothetical protein